jgi:single-strand DNA-binding protein
MTTRRRVAVDGDGGAVLASVRGEGRRSRKPGAAAGTSAAPATAVVGTVTDVSDHRNEVALTGRLAAPATARQLPSGDEIVTWRLTVDRPVAGSSRKVDVVDCAAFGGRVRRQALGWSEGEVIEVTGALRRRFWRGPGGLQSRCEIEVETAGRRRGGARRRSKDEPA